ncbi:hypothetical protein [Maridesulfovibrio sp.]|uniref:hypothetical protein n=1 Tax=Maridesulfovibrio sp. TaxID=2795000 RepID=UPI002A186D2D|nr:hypothetical protein [Maridesulfovibrio sp.]
MNISAATSAYQANQIQKTRNNSSTQANEKTVPNKSQGDTVTISEEARKAQKDAGYDPEAGVYFPDSVIKYVPDCRILVTEVGRYGPVYKQTATAEQTQAWPEYDKELTRIYDACLKKHDITGEKLGKMPKEYQEKFERDLHQMFADDPNSKRIQELMDILDVKVDRLN